jgi:glyoxylase-like metal-dependent hydrolase (beta-lactamase superfamily II)
MKLGDWELKAVMAGRFGLDGGAMFGVVPRALWEKRLPPDDQNRIPMAMRCLLARGGDRTILVDVGSGSGYDEKTQTIYAFDEIEPLARAVEQAGVSPSEVTDVVLTHLHFDHGAGVVEADGGDSWELVFPGATHHVQRAQWTHAFAPNPRDRASYYPDRLRVMEEAGVLKLHDGPWMLCPGMETEVFNGHTPGQQLPRFGEGSETVFFCGDLIPTQHHIPTPYIMSYDLDPVLAMDEKVRILGRAVEQDWVLFFEHDADLAGCRLVRDGKRLMPADSFDFE